MRRALDEFGFGSLGTVRTSTYQPQATPTEKVLRS
jgi:hypothetical protein